MRAFSAFSWSTWVCLSLSWDESNKCWYPGLLSVLPVQKGRAISWDCDSCRLRCLTDGDFSVGRDAKCAEISVFVAKMLMQGEGGLYAPVFPATSTEGWVFLCVHAWKRTLGTFRRLQEVFFTDRGGATCDQYSRRPSSGPYSACFQSRTHFSMPTLDHVISLISFTLVF